MHYSFNSCKSALRAASLSLLIWMTAFVSPAFSQTSISGPTCAGAGVQYSYNISAFYSGTATFQYVISGGVLSTGGSSGSHAGPGSITVLITWNAGFSSGAINLYSNAGTKTLSVSQSATLVGGSITSGQLQTINYNTVPPAGINCSAASGGGCSAPNYSYQWMQSTDNVNFSNVGGATAQNFSFGTTGLTQTTYYKRLVTETTTSATAFSSNTATITVYPQLNPGTITPLAITIAPGVSPGQLTGSTPTGGNGTYGYQWYSSADGVSNWSLVGTLISYTPPILNYTTFYYRAVTSNGVTLSTPIAKVTVTSGVPAATNATGNANTDKNWVLSTGYDPSGNVLVQGKKFFDNSGRLIQAQNKVFYRKDPATVYTHVFASQPVRDVYGRDVLNTMAAPIDYADFNYMPGFAQAADGSNYTYKNFDRFNPSGTETDKTYSPDPIGGQSSKGTLGWYYGANNTWEPYTATTNYPYARSTIYRDGTNNPKLQTNAGEAFMVGSGHELTGYISPVSNELDHYLLVRNRFFATTGVGSEPTTFFSQAIQKVSKDANGNETLTISDKSGKTLLTARPGAGTDLTVNNSVVLNPVAYRLDLPNGSAYGGYTRNIVFGGDGYAWVSQSTDGVTYSQVYAGNINGYIPPTQLTQYMRVESDQPLGGSYVTNDNNGNDVVGCTGCAATSLGNDAKNIYYFTLLGSSAVNITGGGFSLYNMLDQHEAQLTGFTSGNVLNAGYYKLWVTGKTPVTLTYTNYYKDITYYFYDQKGQALASVPPGGTQLLYASSGAGYTNYATLSSIPFVNLNSFDVQGRLLTSTTPDGGTGRIVYRMDGKIRFSQNSQQATTNSYSYTNYDQLGRAIETGQYLPDAGGIAFNSGGMTAILENTSSTGGLTTGTKTDVIMSTYDLPDNTHNQSGYTQDPANLGGAISTNKRYSSIVNNTPSAANLVSQTWYNYDEEGKATWVIKYIASLGTAGYKTTDYTYDAMSRCVKKVFQKNTPAETFVHYYQYDPANGNLWYVYTNTHDDLPSATLQAKYIYYLHGGLKRVELGSSLQGIDYTYTLQGSLKAINNSNGAADPGNDAIANNNFNPDAFGEVLDYYNNDYTNARVSGPQKIYGVNPGSPAADSWMGNVKAMTWYTLKPNGSLGSNNPTTYIFNYDSKYQLTGSNWGNNLSFATAPATFSATSLNQEKIIVPGSGTPGTPAYDPNGNIQYLQRTGAAGTPTDVLAYTYGSGNNRLMQVANTGATSETYTYSYDALGREISETTGTPATTKYLKYDATGKVVMVARDNGFTMPVASFVYDEMGQRIEKITYNSSYVPILATYYYGEAVYTQAITGGTTYGSLTALEYFITGEDGRLGTYYKLSSLYTYELKDHLGNVRAVVAATGAVQTTNDYYPFGMVIVTYGGNYRYGYQGQNTESDGETGWNSFTFRMYNPKIGRWMILDPKRRSPSPYAGMGNDPAGSIDPDGADWVRYQDDNGNWQTQWDGDVHNDVDAKAWGDEATDFCGSCEMVSQHNEATNQYAEEHWWLGSDGHPSYLPGVGPPPSTPPSLELTGVQFAGEGSNETGDKERGWHLGAEITEWGRFSFEVPDHSIKALQIAIGEKNVIELGEMALISKTTPTGTLVKSLTYEGATKILGGAVLTMQVMDVIQNKEHRTVGNFTNIGITAVSIACPVVGLIWGGINLITLVAFHQSAAELIDKGVDAIRK